MFREKFFFRGCQVSNLHINFMRLTDQEMQILVLDWHNGVIKNRNLLLLAEEKHEAQYKLEYEENDNNGTNCNGIFNF